MIIYYNMDHIASLHSSSYSESNCAIHQSHVNEKNIKYHVIRNLFIYKFMLCFCTMFININNLFIFEDNDDVCVCVWWVLHVEPDFPFPFYTSVISFPL